MAHTIENEARLVRAAITAGGVSLARLCTLASTLAWEFERIDHDDDDPMCGEHEAFITLDRIIADGVSPITEAQASVVEGDCRALATQMEANPHAERNDYDYRLASAWRAMADAIECRINATFRSAGGRS